MMAKTPPKRPKNPLATPTVQSAPAEHVCAKGGPNELTISSASPPRNRWKPSATTSEPTRPRASAMPVRPTAKLGMACLFRRRTRLPFLIGPNISSVRMIPAMISRYRLYGGIPVAPAKLA